MRTVWKFPLSPYGDALAMPTGAKVLHVGLQDENVTLWAQVDTEAAPEVRRFHPVGTGHPLPPGNSAYVGTVLLLGGSLVLHFYEVTNV